MLIPDLEALDRALEPIMAGDVAEAAIDTETTEVRDDRFTAFGTDTRQAGVSIAYRPSPGAEPYAFYIPLRHRPYDWRRARPLILKAAPAWVERLERDENVGPAGWADGRDPNLPLEPVLDRLRDAFGTRTHWWLHNALFDFGMFVADGLPVPAAWGDTQFLSIYTDPRAIDEYSEDLEVQTEDGVKRGGFLHQGHGLKHLGEAFLGRPADAQKLLGEARAVLKCDDYSMLPLRTIVAPYACEDVVLTLLFADLARKRAAWQEEPIRQGYERSCAETIVVLRATQRGMMTDQPLAREFEATAERTHAAAVVEANDLAGRPVPIDNGPALAQLLYNDLGIPTFRGMVDTRKPTLKRVIELLDRMPQDSFLQSGVEVGRAKRLVETVIQARKVSKEITSFYRPMSRFAGEDGVIHTVLRQMAARTRRFSSSGPNLQNLPDAKKSDVRRTVIPRPGHVFLLYDFSQIELRIAAHYSVSIPEAFERIFTWGCTMAKRGSCKGRAPHGPADNPDACRKVIHVGWKPVISVRPAEMRLYDGFMTDPAFDPHQIMADLTGLDRKVAKAGNFALLYGAGIEKLSQVLDCSYDEARTVYAHFWDRAYPELTRVKDFVAERLRRVGPPTAWNGQDSIRTLHGARFYLTSPHKGLNYLVQGSAREVMREALIEVDAYCQVELGDLYSMLMTVHDELIVEAPADSVDPGPVWQIARIMEAAGSRSCVPMVVEPQISDKSWGDKQPYTAGKEQAWTTTSAAHG